jgi:hypothetical protein
LRLDTFIAENDEENQLGEENTVMGLEDNVINSYPRFQFSRDSATVLGQNTTCSICLCEYKDSEMLRMMPECRHYFHLCCLDSWLKLNGSCPVCRNSPLPTPLSTPLQEVVPLSQYGDDRRRRRWLIFLSIEFLWFCPYKSKIRPELIWVGLVVLTWDLRVCSCLEFDSLWCQFGWVNLVFSKKKSKIRPII